MEETNKGGRPYIAFTDKEWRQVNAMCAMMCTGEEIASVLGVSYDTLERRVKEKYSISCADYIKEKSASGKASLRRHQYKLAESGNATMLIWLGKQYLGQTDKQEIDHQSTDGSMSPKDTSQTVLEILKKKYVE